MASPPRPSVSPANTASPPSAVSAFGRFSARVNRFRQPTSEARPPLQINAAGRG
jgi:hypothetical protein